MVVTHAVFPLHMGCGRTYVAWLPLWSNDRQETCTLSYTQIDSMYRYTTILAMRLDTKQCS